MKKALTVLGLVLSLTIIMTVGTFYIVGWGFGFGLTLDQWPSVAVLMLGLYSGLMFMFSVLIFAVPPVEGLDHE